MGIHFKMTCNLSLSPSLNTTVFFWLPVLGIYSLFLILPTKKMGQNLKEWAVSESGWFPPYVDPVSPTQVALHNLISTDIFFFILEKRGTRKYVYPQDLEFTQSGLTQQLSVLTILAKWHGSYFHMDELFSNNFSSVWGTNRLFFNIRHACLPRLLLYNKHMYCGQCKRNSIPH